MKINKIIVPFDFTESSFSVIEIAAQIARKNNATVSLIHVVDIPIERHTDSGDLGLGGTVAGIGGYIDHPHEVEEESGGLALHMIDSKKERYNNFLEKNKDVTFEEHVKPDMYQKHLYKFITNESADLVILKTSGKHLPDESKAADIIRYSPVPVLTLHNMIDEFEPKEIVFASDFKDVPDKAIDFLKTMQQTYGAKVHLLKIVTPNLFSNTKENYRLIDEFIKLNSLENYEKHIYTASEIAEGIVDFAETERGDLIIKTTHGRTGISHWLFGSSAESVAIYSRLPVITLNEHFTK